MSDSSKLIVATQHTAPRPVRGSAASRSIMRAAGGELATTYPPMMMKLICIVNGMRLQKPSPKAWAVAQRRSAERHCGGRDDRDGERGEHIGVRNPAFRPGAAT